MQCTESIILYQNPAPLLVSRQAIFPGIAQLPDGTLVALFSIGQAFDAADTRAHVSHSQDEGRTWTTPVRLSEQEATPEESESFKPLLLRDGTLLATGYTFVRPDPLTPIVDPATLALLPLRNKVAFSADGGLTWTPPATFDVQGQPLELSGPCIELASGRIIGAAAPFHLGKTGHEGWIIASDDKGRTWFRLSSFFSVPGGHVAPWECRLAELAPGRVAVMIWAYDNAAGVNLDNVVALSDDGGLTFRSIATGVHGQASNLLALGGNRLLTIHAHREAPVGLIVRQVDITGDRFAVTETLDLMADGAAQASATTGIAQQFGSLKFGQPSLLKLAGGDILAACWTFENSQYVIRAFRLAL